MTYEAWNAGKLPLDGRSAFASSAIVAEVGHIVVTWNEAGEIVAVTRQDDEGRILSVIAEKGKPPAHPTSP